MGFLNLFKKSPSASRRVAVIGLAGMSCRLIKELSANGHLPCISRLLDEGFACEMESTLPPVPSVAWTTCMTGVNPAKHGIFGFMERRRESYGVFFPNASQIAAPALWDVLTAAGKKTLAVNVPQTYPAREINGIMISGFVADDFEKAVYPRRLVAPLQEIRYRIDIAESAADNKDAFFKDLMQVLKKRRETLMYLADKVNWDLLVGVFTCTGPLLKYFRADYENPASPYHDEVLACFHELDRAVGSIVDKLDQDTTLIMLSDHGSAQCSQEVYLNTWLRDEGLLYFLNDPPASFEDLDPERTKAFVLDPGRVYINQKGSMPRGSVAPGQEYERVLKALTENFLSLKDQVTSETVISRVFRKDDLFSGPLASKAPDLVLWGAKGYDLKADIGQQTVFGQGSGLSMNTYNDALFYMRGLNSLNAKPGIRDIAPTILRLLHIPIPKDMDGKAVV